MGQSIGAQKEHGAHASGRERFPDSRCMAEQQSPLQSRQFLGRNPDVGEITKTGIDAVVGLSRCKGPLQGVSRPLYRLPRFSAQLGALPLVGDLQQLRQG